MKYGMDLVGPLVSGQIPERVPISCNLLDQGARELGIPIREYYSKGEYVAEGQLRMREKFGNDVVWGFMYTAKSMEILGSRTTIFAEDGPPNVGELVLTSAEVVDDLDIPEDIYDHDGFSEWRTCLETLAREVGGKVPIVSNVVSCFSFPAIMMGIDQWLELLVFGDRGLIDAVLEKAHLLTTRLATALRRAGANLISYSNPVGTREFLTRKQFEELCLPWVKKDFAVMGTVDMVYFGGGGPIDDQVAALKETCGLSSFYLHPKDDIRAVKKILDGQGIVAGTINDVMLIRNWSTDEIRAEVKRIMDEGSPGGGFMFGTMVMPYLIPEKNIHTMMDAAREYGSYSGSA